MSESERPEIQLAREFSISPGAAARSQFVTCARKMTMNAAKIAAETGSAIAARIDDGGCSPFSSEPCAGVFELYPPNRLIAPETIPITIVTRPLRLAHDQVCFKIRAYASTKIRGPDRTSKWKALQETATMRIHAPTRAHHS